jgi:hypothetical protein
MTDLPPINVRPSADIADRLPDRIAPIAAVDGDDCHVLHKPIHTDRLIQRYCSVEGCRTNETFMCRPLRTLLPLLWFWLPGR